MTMITGALLTALSALPILQFQLGQIPKFFQTQEFFVLASQFIIEIVTGITSGLIGAIVSAFFGVPAA